MAAQCVAVILIVGALAGPPTAAAAAQGTPGPYLGRAVADVLKDLQATRLKIIFSSALVPPSLRVVSEPRGADAKAIALQILEPHGLTLEQGPGGTLLVVARPPRKSRPRPPAPARDPVPPPEPVPDAVEALRIEEHVEVSNRPEVSSRVYAVEPQAVRELAGGMENVLQAVQILPGVVGLNDEEGKVAVRGGGPEHNMILLDGVQIHSPQRLGEFTTSFFNPATAANVALDSSGLEARFGGRLSSVLSLETRDGTTARRLAFSGSLGLTSGDVLFEGRMPGTASGSWWATLRGTSYRFVSDRFTDGTMPGFGDVQVKATLFPSPRTRLTLFGLAGRETLTEIDYEPDSSPVVRASNAGQNRIVAGTLRWMPSSRFSSVTTVSEYATDARAEDRMLAFVGAIQPFDRRIEVQDIAVRHQFLYATSQGRMIDAGVDLHRISSAWRMVGIKQPDYWRGIGPSTWGELIDYSNGPLDSRIVRTQAGAWGQVRLDLGRVMTIEPGVRIDWNSFTGEAAWQPRVRASRVIGRTSVWTGFSVQAQTPSYENLQGFDYFDFVRAAGTLQNEQTRQVVAGFERPLGGGFGVRVEGYYRSFDRLVVQQLETDEERAYRLRNHVIPPDMPPDDVVLEHRPTVVPGNTGRGRGAGLEVVLRRERRRVTGWIGYTLAKATRDLHGYTVPFDFDRRHGLNAVVEVPFTAKIRGAATFQLASGLPVTPIREEVVFGTDLPFWETGSNSPLHVLRNRDGSIVTFLNVFQRRLSTINADRLSGYSRTDVRVTYATGRHWEFYGEVLNLFNHRNHVQEVSYIDVHGNTQIVGRSNIYNTFERMISAGLRVTF